MQEHSWEDTVAELKAHAEQRERERQVAKLLEERTKAAADEYLGRVLAIGLQLPVPKCELPSIRDAFLAGVLWERNETA